MDNNSLLVGLLIILAILAGLSGFYGRNINKYVWRLSLIGAALSGIIIGILVAPFPKSLLSGLLYSTLLVSIIVLLRLPRRNHPK